MQIKLWCTLSLYLALIILLSLFTACKASVEEEVTSPVEITDQTGREIRLEKAPERIISLAPSNTEILFALGLGDKVVGVTQFCNYPSEAQDKPKIGGFSATEIDVSMEQIVAADPDLILATETHVNEAVPKLAQLLPEANVVVLLTQTESFDIIFQAINLVGRCTHTEDKANQLVAEMKSRIKTITDKTNKLQDFERPGVLYIVWHDPIYAIGGGTLGNSLIEAAGGVNIFQGQIGAPIVDLETIISRNPQVILGSAAIGIGADLPYQFTLNEERLKVVDARINNRVYGVNDDITGRPGPRIVEALEQLAKMLHPELFE